MLGVQDAVHDRIAHVQVGRRHVDLGTQDARAVGKLASLHALEQIQIFFDRAIAVGTVFAGLGQRAPVLADFIGRQVVDVGLALFDQLDRPLVELAKIIRCVEQAVPVETEPLDIFLDRLDVLDIFLLGIGVVEAQVGVSAELVGQPEVDADRLGMPDVEVSIGLRRKAGLHPAVVLVGLEIFGDAVAQEIRRTRFRGGIFVHLGLGGWGIHKI